jgi:LacI family repressor for deo operon, udp, cdd, tsx, nupC, and nupG
MQRAGAVLILVPDLGKPFYSRILAGISDGFADSDYAVLIADTESRPLREGELLGYFLDGRIDGVISLDGGLDRQALACVRGRARRADRVSCANGSRADFPVIRATMPRARALPSGTCTRWAIPHRPCHGAGGQCPDRRPRRDAGGTRALGLPARAEWIIRGDFSLESGHEAARKILAMENARRRSSAPPTWSPSA